MLIVALVLLIVGATAALVAFLLDPDWWTLTAVAAQVLAGAVLAFS